MQALFNIFYFKILLFIKVNSPFNFATIVKSISSALVYSVFAYGCFALTINSIEYLLLNIKIGSFLLHRFVLVVLFIFFIAINVGNMVVSFSTLYKSKEVFYLLTKPISFTKIFLIKFLDNFFYSSTTLLMIISAVLLGYGVYFDLSFWLYPFILFFLILPFMFTAGSAGVIILLTILRLASRWGIKKILAIIGFGYGTAIVSFYFISNPINLVEQVFDYYPNINLYFGFLENGLVKFLPNYWIAESLYWISENKFDRAIPFIYANLITSIFIFTITLIIARKWFYKTWLTSLKINSELKNNNKEKNLFFGFDRNSTFKGLNESILKENIGFFLESQANGCICLLWCS